MLTAAMIGDKIAGARKNINLSQAQLAEQMFISPQAVGKWERGESMPDIISLNRLAKILGVDLNFFSESFPTSTVETEKHDLTPVDQLSGSLAELASLKQRKKQGWDMSSGNWVDADFSGLKNLHEKFSSSNMQRCLFIGSDLAGLLLKNNNVDRCDFSESDISGSRIQGSNLANDSFKKCSLKETEFTGSYISGCDFSEADLTGILVKSGGFEKNTVTNTVWNGSAFVNSNLLDMVFEGRMEDCRFENCSFKRVTFEKATLTNCFFKNSSLKRVRFIDCQADGLTYAFLKNGKADLSGVTLLNP